MGMLTRHYFLLSYHLMSAKFFISNKKEQIAVKYYENSQEKSIGFVTVNVVVSGKKKTD